MTRRSLFPGLWFAAALIVCGCGDGDATRPEPAPVSPVQAAFARLDARLGEHHAYAAHAIDVRAIREEATRYACDMDPLMDTMLYECDVMLDDPMGPHQDMHAIRNLAHTVLDMVERHRDRMHALSTIGEMREECDEHHESMRERMDEMGHALPGGRMGGHR